MTVCVCTRVCYVCAHTCTPCLYLYIYTYSCPSVSTGDWLQDSADTKILGHSSPLWEMG